MKRVLLQAGHEGRTSGATGAPGEQSFNVDVADKVAASLREKNIEVRRVPADPTNAQISGDWDLFLAIHYDADIYNSGGGFVDFPDTATDGATVQSQAMAAAIREEYFPTTGIVNKPARSNSKTRFYYMWSRISSATPCVIIECGVGQHKPDDYEVLQNNRPLVVKGITNGILKALQAEGSDMTMYRGYDLDNKESMKVAVDSHLKVVNRDVIPVAECEAARQALRVELTEERDRAVQTAYSNGKADGMKVGGGTTSVPGDGVDLTKWEADGMQSTVKINSLGDTVTRNYKPKA